ncbi:(2Fe-2S)-binding protein [Nocardioides sp. BP30]|uniref:(2Fe-2S)-binding protein n=1 Tax=Nocardioides sp. BP30 TaxID=3036374 RepID=UPI0024692B00|nr:(2Fe-2S)-binding protein [Nocardioides sp. BP30]WGL52362.1 (2Fe-2S)-binding protein [Nocardioides sp. BP30]
MIVCHCEVVNDKQIAAALTQGARTVAQVCGATGAGRSCGSCVFTVKRIICDHREAATHATLQECDEAS